MRSGRLYEPTTLEPLTSGRARSLWPTPTHQDQSQSRRHGYTFAGHAGTTLTDAVLIHLGLLTERKRGQRIESPAGASPAFVEALMGFPPGWTVPDSAPSETPLRRKSPKRSAGLSARSPKRKGTDDES